MCGIAGIVGLDGRPAAPEDVRTMCDAMVHRGPDEAGFYSGGPAALGMRRLSIIDVAAGHQPVRSEDGSVVVVCNGEIYNFRELRADLSRRGHHFAGGSDIEVTVHLYEEEGEAFLSRLRGMFALALWDARRRRLILARDRLGIKPLHYALLGGRLLFASELKALLRLPEIEGRINWSALGHLFTSLCTPASESIVEGVKKLEPGRLLVADQGREPRLATWWTPRFEPDRSRTEEECAERLRALLEESVRLHLVSDVPLGAFLSGGIDSSAVVATMARLVPGPVKTFSIGFDEPGFSEIEPARAVARRFGTEHHELILRPDAVAILDDLARALDEPFGDASAIPTYMVSQLAARHVKVVLSGDGGDEIFAGYDKYRVEGRERKTRFLPAPARRALGRLADAIPEGQRGHNLLRHFSLAGPDRYLDASTLFRRESLRRLFRPEAFEQMTPHDPWERARDRLARHDGHWLSALQALDLETYLPLDILTKVDRMSMAHSLEARVPLLDHRIVEFAATLPPEMLLRRGTTKWIFKRALRGILPEPILARRKHGFAVPIGRWLRGDLGRVARDLLFSERCRRRGLFDESYLEKLLGWHERGRDLDLQIWTLLSFETWCRSVLEARPPAGAACGLSPAAIQGIP
jgi:asparagine synthase (glutamine-hydrolysing)